MRLPSIRTCEPFLRLSSEYCARRVRKIATRCHSVFETHSSSAFFQERCVATESTVNFVPLPFAWRCSGSAPTNPTSVTELRYMSFSFFLPHFPEAPQSEGRCSQGERLHSGRDPATLGRNRESRRREAAGRRNSPEAVPRKRSGRK